MEICFEKGVYGSMYVFMYRGIHTQFYSQFGSWGRWTHEYAWNINQTAHYNIITRFVIDYPFLFICLIFNVIQFVYYSIVFVD